jgi:hypothetical protein
MTALPARAEAVVAVAWGCASGRGKAVCADHRGVSGSLAALMIEHAVTAMVAPMGNQMFKRCRCHVMRLYSSI